MSLISSICRSDWNIVVGMFSLCILTKYFRENPQYFTGLLFVLHSSAIIADIIWMIMMIPSWSSDESANPMWKSLNFVHSLTVILSFIELTIKGVIVFTCYSKGALNDFQFVRVEGKMSS